MIKLFAAVIAAVAISGAHAADYPTKPIRLLVPYAAGGPVDIMARIVAQKLGETLGQQVVVDNRAGANGNIAGDIVAKSAPDGYTLLMGANGNIAVNPSLYARMPFDPVKDLAPISMVAGSPMILVVNPSVPAGSVKELIALAKAKPGSINVANSGNGSTAHLAAELFKSMAGVSLVQIPYKGAGPALADVVGGQVQMMITGVSSTLPFVKTGKLKALGVSSEKRLALMPELPTIAESVPGYEVTTWYGVLAPAGTPKPIIAILHSALVKLMNMPDTQERMASLGAGAMTDTPEQFANRIRSETGKWAQVVKSAGVRVE